MDLTAKDPNAVTVAIDATDVIALTAPREQNDATTALQIRQPTSDSRPPHNKQHSRLSANKTANDKTEMPAQIAGQDGQIVVDLQIATASPQLMISATELTINCPLISNRPPFPKIKQPTTIRPTAPRTNNVHADVAAAAKYTPKDLTATRQRRHCTPAAEYALSPAARHSKALPQTDNEPAHKPEPTHSPSRNLPDAPAHAPPDDDSTTA